ncbi:nucleolar transcription factor 1-A-like isoform X2 [Centroberyx affinis]|uniref:nucleolar transcription factor 1-A-like isoform X2 n=1 Tax=Centroberyx affinis TaxID=166261 RepID=UPI003A5BD9B6
MSQMETEESEWATDDLQKLLHAMKNSIPKRDTMNIYTKGQRILDWEKVAFHPYSSEACRQKWQEISQKMRKIRTLTELIVEAEDAIHSPLNKVHPERPKKPNPPNAMFYKEKWAKYHEKHPDLSGQQLFKLMNKKYQELPEQKKAKYVKKFQLEHEEYMQSMLHLRKRHKVRDISQLFLKNTESPQTPTGLRSSQQREKFLQANPDEEQHSEKEGGRSKEESRQASTPSKPPINGYNLFCKEQKSSMEGVSSKDYITVCAQRWRQLPEREKDKYKTRCRELKRQYKVKLSDYLCDLEGEEQQQILKENGIETVKQPKRFKKAKPLKTFLGEPKTPSRAGNVVFCRKQMELLKSDIPYTRDRMAHVGRMWQGLSKREKEKYKEKADGNFVKYTVELQKWFKTLPAVEQVAYLQHNPRKSQFLDVKQMSIYPEEGPSNHRPSKCQFLEVEQISIHPEEGPSKYRPSDSEDEDIENSSSDEEEEGEDFGYIEVEDEDEDEIIWQH